MKIYYNENDPKAAAWLVELVREGHIPEGDLDDRSILDVKASDLLGYDSCHFFAGIGGWPYALRLAGWPDDRPVWTGSCPCQPFSVAGTGLGEADERHLWPAFRELIRGVNAGREDLGRGRIPAIAGEQVASKAGRQWLAGVRADLETLGYVFGASDLCSAGVGSPNIRQRLFWMGYAGRPGDERGRGPGKALCETGEAEGETQERERGGVDARSAGLAGRVADPNCFSESEERACNDVLGKQRAPVRGWSVEQSRARTGSRGGFWDHPEGAFRGGDGEDPGAPRSDRVADSHHPQRGPINVHREDERDGSDAGRSKAHGEPRTCGEVCRMADVQQQGLEGHPGHVDGRDQPGRVDAVEAGSASPGGGIGGMAGPYEPISGEEREQRGGELGGARGDPRTLPRTPWDDYEVIVCRDRRLRRIEPGTSPLAYGVPGRVGLLRGYGNAINPVLAAEFIQACEEARLTCR